jgi:3D (Asp-Asp-Asp) domain-containing protein
VKKRLQVIQRQGPTPNLVQALLQADSLTQLSQAVYVIKTVQQADDLAIHNLFVSLKALKTTQANLLTKQAQLVAQQQQLDQAKAQLQTDLTQLKLLMAQNQTQMAQLTAQKDALIQQIDQEAKAKAQEQAQAQAADQQRSNAAAIFSGNGLNLTPSGPTATGVKISFYDPAVLGSTMGYNGVAANLAVYPKGTKLKIVFADGTTIHRVVNDTGTFVYTSPNQIDVAWPNAAIPSYGITSATVTVES